MTQDCCPASRGDLSPDLSPFRGTRGHRVSDLGGSWGTPTGTGAPGRGPPLGVRRVQGGPPHRRLGPCPRLPSLGLSGPVPLTRPVSGRPPAVPRPVPPLTLPTALGHSWAVPTQWSTPPGARLRVPGHTLTRPHWDGRGVEVVVRECPVHAPAREARPRQPRLRSPRHEPRLPGRTPPAPALRRRRPGTRRLPRPRPPTRPPLTRPQSTRHPWVSGEDVRASVSDRRPSDGRHGWVHLLVERSLASLDRVH